MRKFLTFDEGKGDTVELSPLSYREFVALNHWNGSDDMAWAEWLRQNNLQDPDDYDDETLQTSQFWVSDEPRQTPLLFKPDLGEDASWVPFDKQRWLNTFKVLRTYLRRN